MPSKTILRTLGLTPMIGTPIIGNMGKTTLDHQEYTTSELPVYLDFNDDKDGNTKDPNVPPSYSATSARSLSKPIIDIPTSVNLRAYHLPQSILSADQAQTTTSFAGFIEDPQTLVKFICEQAALPPRPLIQIKGSHSEYGKAYGPDKIDFDLVLDAMPLLVRDPEQQQLNHLDVVAAGSGSAPLLVDYKLDSKVGSEADLQHWAEMFWKDPAESKSFTLERKVTNWDTGYLTAQIRNLVASTKFQGDLAVTFPITHAIVVVRTGNLSSYQEKESWVGKILKKDNISSQVVSDLDPSTKSYPAVQSIWPYATAAPGAKGRECAVQSEQEWIQVWKDVLRNAVLQRKVGRVGIEEWREARMGAVAAEADKAWGIGRQW